MACQEGGRTMLQSGGGVIVNLTSIMAERGVPNASLYGAAQAAVLNLTRGLALEWARKNIRVNAIEMGWVEDDRSPAVNDEEFRRHLDQISARAAAAEARRTRWRAALPGQPGRRIRDRPVNRDRWWSALPGLVSPCDARPGFQLRQFFAEVRIDRNRRCRRPWREPGPRRGREYRNPRQLHLSPRGRSGGTR